MVANVVFIFDGHRKHHFESVVNSIMRLDYATGRTGSPQPTGGSATSDIGALGVTRPT
jgi:hypothetical protein